MTIFAFSLPFLFGAAALAIDLGYVRLLQVQLQTAADAAALAAVKELPDEIATRNRAIEYASKNLAVAEHGNVVTNGDVKIGNWDDATRTFTDGGTPLNSVRVVAQRSKANGNEVDLFLANVIGIQEQDVGVSAIALLGDPLACVIALDPTGTGVSINSGSSLVTFNCGIQVNSSSSSAITTNSGSSVTVNDGESFCVVGNYTGSGYNPAPETGCDPVPDPLAGLPIPPTGSCDHTTKVVVNGGSQTLTPGRYCAGLEITSAGTADFEPGLYIIEGDKFTVNAGSTITGDDVTFFFADKDAIVLFNQGSSVQLAASTGGPYTGILFFQNPGIGDITVNEINSDSTSFLNGALYFPRGEVRVNSDSTIGGGTSCMNLVAYQINLNSASDVEVGSNHASCGTPLSPLLTSTSILVD